MSDEVEYLEFTALEALDYGTEIRGVLKADPERVLYALKGQMYDGEPTWFVSEYGTYRTPSLLQIGEAWTVVGENVEA